MKIGDVFLCAILLIISALLWVSFGLRSKGSTAVVKHNGTIVERVFLDSSGEFRLDAGGFSLTIEYHDGGIAVVSSTCPDKVCVHTGRLTRTGQISACVPAGVVIEIEGTAQDFDTVS